MATKFRIVGKSANAIQVRLKGEHAVKAYSMLRSRFAVLQQITYYIMRNSKPQVA